MMKAFLPALACCIAAFLSACATPPSMIDPVKTASTEVCTEYDRKYLAYLVEEQGKMARNDAIGVFMIGLPLGSMGQGDYSGEIAELKGRCPT